MSAEAGAAQAPNQPPKPAPKPAADQAAPEGNEKQAQQDPGGQPEQGRAGLVGAADPLAGEGLPGGGAAASRIYRSAVPAFTAYDSSTLISGTIGSINVGVPQTRLLSGPLPEDELRRLRRVFQEPEGYAGLKTRLHEGRLLVLSGQPGTGRSFLALSLLDDLARGQVSRMDSRSDLSQLDATHIAEGHGYALEPATGLPDETGLDRLCALLKDRDAYAVLLAIPEPGDAVARRGRYHVSHRTASAHSVLEGHLTHELVDEPEELLDRARLLGSAPLVVEALGLDELRPSEAARLAGLLAGRVREELSEDQLVAACRGFANAQAVEWFSGDRQPEAPALLRDAAYRIAVAALGGASLSSVTEAAELLAWELAVTVDPEAAPGRPLFSEALEARLASARAVVKPGTELVGDEEVPVRTVRFEGDALAAAVLKHLWDHRHNVRGPVLRWLGGLCQDPRPEVWVRAAVAAGELCRLDCSHTLSELVQPMAGADQARRRLFAATVLDVAVASGDVGSAVRTLVAYWAREGDDNQRWTAAAVLGRGRATAGAKEALDLLASIGVVDEGALRVPASLNVVHYVGASCDPLTLERIRGWMSDPRRPHQDLGLQSAVFLASTKVSDLWSPNPALEGYAEWPLMLALVALRPAWAPYLAGLLWTALQTSRSYEAALDSVSGWLTGQAGKPWAEAPVTFLPMLVHTADDRHRLLSLIKELSEDPDNPLDAEQVRRLAAAVQGVGTR
ncbi:hypothetical protein DN069_08285 [Streptacidiphilus pinicola]|uniref:Uncharacterized protein n=1 Tax=Streptacidiphilus pinicola TaxID=2219663 RepID=A0A2X0ILW0_9ACTN|nr:hypothetical protein [Streptacidiphilus pinicola]RAG86104.1 hypothetical protein DN069_08285 [Streptacidiphilus pinicola]